MPTCLKLIALSAVVVVVSVRLKQFSTIFKKPEIILAHHDEHLFHQVSQEVVCSEDYQRDTYVECIPRRCGRYVSDILVSMEEAEYLLRLAKKGFAYGGSSGGASILDLHSGALSMGDKFVNVYKDVLRMDFWVHVMRMAESGHEIFSEEDFDVYRKVRSVIHRAIAEQFSVPAGKLFLTNPTFFSRMDTKPAHTIHDEYWHQHVDKETYGSFHYTSLLYLATYKKDFIGGRFMFVDKDLNVTVEPRLGRVLFFTSGSENVHFVEPVKAGERYAITISFTCDREKGISDLKFSN